MLRPAPKPPIVSAGRLKPANQNPNAAPGRIPWATASPIRLIRLRIRNTPKGAVLHASTKPPSKARRMNTNSLNGCQKWLTVASITPPAWTVSAGSVLDWSRTRSGRF